MNNLNNNIINPLSNNVKAAAIYCRVSTEKQDSNGTSLDTQRAACLKYCQEHNYSVTHQFIETYTGLAIERPQLDELRRSIRNREIDRLVIYCLDRLSRDPTHGVILTQELDKYGVKLEAVTEDIDNSELGKLISYIRGYAGKLEAEKIRERTGRGIRERVFTKGKPVTYRRASYGFDWDRVNNSLVPNSDYGTAKFILESAINGQGYDWIIAELKRRGITSPAGLGKWNKHTISTIIHNPVYAGQYYAFKSEAVKPTNGNGKSKKLKSSVKRLPQEDWYYLPSVKVESPIITLEQRALLLDQLQKRQKLSSRNAKREYMLRGMIACETHKGVNGEPRVYHGQPHHDNYRYTCSVGGCENAFIPGPWADRLVKLIVQGMLLRTPDDFYKNLIQSQATRDFSAEQKRIEKEQEKITDKLAKLEDDKYEGQVDVEVYQRLKAQYMTTRQNLKDSQNHLLDEMRIADQQGELIKSWLDLRHKFMEKVIGRPPNITVEKIENILRKNPELMSEAGQQQGEAAIKGEATRIFEQTKDRPEEPMTVSEWRALLSACNFRWMICTDDNRQAREGAFKQIKNRIHARILRKSAFYIDLPVANPNVVKDIALHSPANELRNQQYFPIRFSLADIVPEMVEGVK